VSALFGGRRFASQPTDILVVTKSYKLRMPQWLPSVHSRYSICAFNRGLSHRHSTIFSAASFVTLWQGAVAAKDDFAH